MSIIKEFRDFISGIGSVSLIGDNGFFGASSTAAGVSISELSAMQSAAVTGCVRIISGLIAGLQLNIYEVSQDGEQSRTVAYDHDLQYFLNTKPNPEMDGYTFKETLQIHLLLTGNAYIEIVHDKGGKIAGLYIRNPLATFPTRDRITGELIFVTTDGMQNNTQRPIAFNSMVHIKNMSLDGLIGMNPIRSYAREVIGYDIAAASYGARLLANDSSPSGILTTDKSLKPDTRKQLEESWKSGHSGQNAKKFALLDGGLKWEQISMSPEESQFLQTRGFSRDQIATIYGVPPHMLGDDRSEKAANIEQRMLELLNVTLKPWLKRWEKALEAKLLPEFGRTAGLYQIGFDTTELEASDFETKLKSIATGRQWGIYTANEGRKKLGLNPYDPASTNPADQLWQPVNMAVAQGEGEAPAVPATPPVADPNEPPQAEQKGIQPLKRVFTDAFTRCLKREKRDLNVIQRTFSPSLFGLCDYFAMNADMDFRAGDELPSEVTDFVVDYVGGMQKRASNWTDEAVTIEFDRAVKALRMAVYREVAIAKAKAQEV